MILPKKERLEENIFLAKLLHLGGEKPHQSVERVVHLQESAARSHFQINVEELDKYLINSTILHSASLGIYLRQTSASTGQSGLRVKLKIVSAFPPQGAGWLGRGGGKWFGFQETTSCEWRRERGKLPKQKKISIKMKNWRRSWQRFPSDCESSWTGWRKDFLASGRARLTIITGLQSFALFWCRFRFVSSSQFSTL